MACPSCGSPPDAATARMLRKPADGGAGRQSRSARAAADADGNKPTTITVGDFTLLVDKGKRAQRKARQQMRKLQDLAAAAKADQAEAATENQSPATATEEQSASMQTDCSALQAMGDEELEMALKALCRSGLPGRDDYLAEQTRRREAKLAAKPAWVKARAVEAKWKKAQAKVAKAEAAAQQAKAAVDSAKAAVAKAEASALEANRLLAEAQVEETAARADIDRPGSAAEAPAAANASFALPGLPQLPAGYRQQPEVAAKLQQLESLLQEVLAGAPAASTANASAAATAVRTDNGTGSLDGCSVNGQRGRPRESNEERAASGPAARDNLWAAASTIPVRSRSPARDLRYAGRRASGDEASAQRRS